MTQKLTPLDMAVTDEKLQTLKLMLPYVLSEVQPFLGIYVKFAEFQNTVSYFQQFPGRHFGKCRNQNVSVESIVEDLKEYYPEKNFEMMETFIQAMNMMEMMQNMNAEDMFSNMNMSDMFQVFQQERAEENGRMDESSGNEES